MSDPERTRRVAAKARKDIMSHVQYVPHKSPDTHPGTEADTESTMAELGQGAGGENTKHLHLDLPMHMQLREAEKDRAPESTQSADKNLGGGPTSKTDEGSGGPHGVQTESADPESPHMDHDHPEPHEALNADSHADEAGEEGAGRRKDLLSPNMGHSMVHSAAVKKILGAYKRSK